MVVQPRGSVLRLFRQHDHALACGEMALEWAGGELSDDAMLAIGQHDCGWIDDDETPRVNPQTGAPFDFIRMPLKDRRRIYQSSIDDAERMSAYAGLLVSTHFSAFLSAEAAPEFVAAEDARRARLSQDVEREAGARLEADYAVLKALDLLSLAGCLTPPGSDKENWPRWLGGMILIDAAETELRWTDEQTLVVDPFPLRREVQVSLPFVEVERRRFADDAELRDAIRNGERGSATVRFVGVTGC